MRRIKIVGGLLCLLALAGCGSAYSGLVDSQGLGAADYRPAVYVELGNEAKYEQVLPICRQAAINRQMTAAQEAQLKTITGVAQSTVEGATAGLELANIFNVLSDAIGTGDVDMVEQGLIGAGIGLVGGLVDAFASGSLDTAEETKLALLACIRTTSRNGELWTVLE